MMYLKKPFYNDPRSKGFSHQRFFGSVTPLNLPRTLGKSLRQVENQGSTQRCAAYAGAVNGGYIHGFRFSPDWQALKIGQIQGHSVDVSGSDPNSALKSQCQPLGGYLLYEKAPVTLENDGVIKSGNPGEWPNFDNEAGGNANLAYLKPDGKYDVFDNIRSALYIAYDETTKLGACVQTFGRFFQEWEYNYIIPQAYENMAGWHSFLFVDFTELNGIPYLIAQNSYPQFGNGGFHLFPREVVNREFTISGTSLKIPKPLSALQIATAKQETSFGKIQRLILSIWYSLSNMYGSTA